MNQLGDQGLKPINKQLGNDFDRGVLQGDVSVFTDSSWPINFRDEGYERAIYTLKTYFVRMEGRTETVEIMFNKKTSTFSGIHC